MAQLLKTPIAKIVNVEGGSQISISVEPIVIEINLTVNSDGLVGVNTVKAQTVTEEEEKINWAIPTFSGKKIKFGKTGD